MPHIGVLFEIRKAETLPGQVVAVVGGRPELGNWDPFDYKAAGLQLRTSAVQYPSWAMSAPVWIELGRASTPAVEFEETEGDEEDEDDDGDRVAFEEEQAIGSTSEEDEDRDSDWQSTEPASPAGGLSVSAVAVNAAPGEGFLRLEYKYVRDRRQSPEGGPSIQWEDCIANRRALIPREHGSIWIVSDTSFNQNGETQVSRTTLAEVLARRGDLDPEWTTGRRHVREASPESERPHLDSLSSPGSAPSDLTSCSRHTTSTIFMW